MPRCDDGILIRTPHMSLIDVFVLGAVQGITEFLPISSSGHLLFAELILGLQGNETLAFQAILHLGTTAAVLVYFRKDVWLMMHALLRKLGRLPTNERDLTMLSMLLIASIPAGFIGFFLEEIISTYFTYPAIVAIVLVVGAIFFMYAEWRYYLEPRHGSLTLRTACMIGCFQVLALLPGFSRSGATLAGGMLLGLSRYESARFSFLLAIPITLVAGSKKLLDTLVAGVPFEGLVAMLAATVVSFVVALFVIHYFLAYIRRYTLWPFAWYSLLIALIVWFLLWVS